MRLGCPHLRYDQGEAKWIAREKDPCPKCERELCYNQGHSFDDQERFRVLNDKGEKSTSKEIKPGEMRK
jgi:hypothetical protein